MTKEVLEKEQERTRTQAKEFINAVEEDRFWYIGGEIVGAGITFDVWNDDIHEVCNWVLINGRGLLPDMAQHLIDRHI